MPRPRSRSGVQRDRCLEPHRPGAGTVSMADTIVISADALMLVSKHLHVPADTVRQAVKAFNEAVAATGEPWGNDDIGKNWSKLYVPGKNDALQAFKEIIEGLLQLSNDF